MSNIFNFLGFDKMNFTNLIITIDPDELVQRYYTSVFPLCISQCQGFHKIFGGEGLAFGDDFRSPSGMESGGGGTCIGDGVRYRGET